MLEILRSYKASIFRALAHPVRVAIVEYLQYGERDEQRLREKVGAESDQFTQHLSLLCRKNIVRCRTVSGQTYYSLRDPAFGKVLEALREYFLNHLTESIELLREERNGEQPPLEPPREGRPRAGEVPDGGGSGPASSR